LARAEAQATVLERLLFLDSSVDVRQVEADPFGGRVGGEASANARTAGSYRISPYLSRELSPRTKLLARYDRSATRYARTLAGDEDAWKALARFELTPEPVGATLEWSSQDTEFAQAAAEGVRIDRLVAGVNFAFDADWVLGATAGRERSRFDAAAQSDSVYGARLFWAPGLRTELAAGVDHRFFGTGWNLRARHRTPQMSFELRALRDGGSATGQAATSSFGGGLASFLDAVLTTRNPDAVQRAALVDSELAQRGLRGALQGAVDPSAGYAQLRTVNELGWVFLGSRTTLSLAAYREELRRLARAGAVAPGPTADASDSRQQGVSLGWNRRLTPQMALDTSAIWSRIDGLAARDGERTRETVLRAALVRNLSPKASASVGLSVRRVDSNALNVAPFDETAGFVGLAQRF
jgi:uncharacterized protein (PEP-CTERM system associated)